MQQASSIKLVMTLMVLGAGLHGQDLTITGFVDGSTALPVSDGTNLEFSFDQLEIDLEKTLGDGISLRADIDLVEGGADVEQAYVTVAGMTFGKFNAPIGWELLDAPDMYQFSHTLVFDYALPTNLVGFSYARELGAGLDGVVYVANGWDLNYADDGQPIFGGRLGYGGVEGLNVGLSAIQNNDLDLVIDVDATLTMVENLLIGLEVNQGGYAKDELGWMVMANYSIPGTPFAVTFRQDGLAEGGTTTISPSYSFADGAGVLFEYRIGKDPFGADINEAAVEFTFSF
ncbi:MAG: outer membrane beta-barrel protein [Candidatus Marinimicrobia bacterium]|nr:outer membrane beta-barrel protein [Candidatus Neomarinimicrobiota bacterium]